MYIFLMNSFVHASILLPVMCSRDYVLKCSELLSDVRANFRLSGTNWSKAADWARCAMGKTTEKCAISSGRTT